MSLVIAEDFEAGLGAWTLNGLPTTGAAAAHTGSLGLIIDTSGGAAIQHISRALAGGTRAFVGRYYLTVVTRPGITTNMLQVNTTTAAQEFKLQLLATGVIRAQVGTGTTVSSAALTNGQKYRIDVRMDSTGTTGTIDWQIDGVVQTQATRVQAAQDLTQMVLGLQQSTIAKYYIDTLAVGNAVGDYPFGANPLLASSGLASGTGSTHSVASSELDAEPNPSTGTGAASTAVAKPGAAAGLTAGTGVASSASEKVAATGALTSGTGSAGLPFRSLAASSAAAAAAGSAYAAGANATLGGTSLTIHMG